VIHVSKPKRRFRAADPVGDNPASSGKASAGARLPIDTAAAAMLLRRGLIALGPDSL